MLKKLYLSKIGGLSGILGPIIAFTSILLAIYYSPWFSWTENWLSDLGVYENSSAIFNTGLILAGIFGTIFTIAIMQLSMLKNILGRLGTTLLFIDMLALSAVGIFPEDTGSIHTSVSVLFFALIPLSLLLIGFALRKSSEKRLGLFVIYLGIISICLSSLFLVPRPMGSNAIAEIFPAILIAIFSKVLGIKLLRSNLE